MNEQRRYDVDWTDENNPQIVIAQPGDQHAMTIGEAQQVVNEATAEGSARTIRITNADTPRITIGDLSSAQTVEIAPWTPEDWERYGQTGETPLARLHRENLQRQWSTGPDRDDEK
jgi:hypothetical protein